MASNIEGKPSMREQISLLPEESLSKRLCERSKWKLLCLDNKSVTVFYRSIRTSAKQCNHQNETYFKVKILKEKSRTSKCFAM